MTIRTSSPERIEDWSRSRPHIVLVNGDIVPAPTVAGLPPELSERLNGERPDFLVASRAELDRLGIVLAHDQLARFLKGEPVLLIVGRIDHRAALKRGRRQKEELERSVQDALAVTTFVGAERLCAWLQARDGRRLAVTVPELRDRVIELLAAEAWLDDPNAAGTRDRQSFFRTQFDAGGRLVASWYPWATRPDDLSRVARQIVETSSQGMDRTLIVESIGREVAMIQFMLRCLRRATTLVLTAHEMSEDIRKHDRMTKSQQAVLAGATIDRPTFFEAARAALDGNFNPSELFGNLLSYHGALELTRVIGGHGRGHDLRLDAGMAGEMKRLIAIRDDFDAITLPPGEMPFDEQAAALVITKAADELYSRSIWHGLLDEAIASGGVILPGRTGGRAVR